MGYAMSDAELVRIVMAIKGFTKQEMMEFMGVSRQTIYAWLNNKQNIAQFRKPKMERVVFEFIEDFKGVKPITGETVDTV